MADEISSLGIAVDSQSAATAVDRLDKLTESSKKTEAATESLSKTTDKSSDAQKKQSDATKRAADETAKATSAARAYEASVGTVRSRVDDLVRSAGVLGTVIGAAAGPWLILGVAIGGVISIMRDLQRVADEAGQKAVALKQLSEATRLSIDQIRGLKKVAGEFGVSGDQLETWLQRASFSIEHAREGTGELIAALNKIDPTFARQVQNSKTLAEALDVLSQAAQRAKDQGQDVSLFWRDVFGRGSSRADPVLQAVQLKGGIDAVAGSMQKLLGTTSEEVDRRAELTRRLEVQQKQYESMKAQLLEATRVLELQVASQQLQNDVLKGTLDLRNKLSAVQSQTILGLNREKVAIDEVTEAEVARTNAARRIGGARGSDLLTSGAARSALSRGDVFNEGSFAVPKQDTVKPVTDSVGELQKKANQAFNDLTRLMGVLGGAATIQDQAALSLAKLNKEFANMEHGLTGDQSALRARIEAFNKLNEASQLLSVRASVLGQGITVEEQMLQKRNDLLKAQAQGASFTEKEIANTQRLNREQLNGVAGIKAQTDATRVEVAVANLGIAQATQRRAVLALELEDRRKGITVSEQDKKAREDAAKAAGVEAEALAKINLQNKADFERKTVFFTPEELAIAREMQQIFGPSWQEHMKDNVAAQMRWTDALKETKDAFMDLGKDLGKALLAGTNVFDALISSLDKLAAKLLDKAFQDAFQALVTQDPMMAAKAGVEAAVAIGMSLFTQNAKQAKELEKAKQNFADMADEVHNFNSAASGFTLSPLVSAIQSIKKETLDLVKAATAAQDIGAAIQVILSGVKQVVNTVEQFTKPKDLSDSASQILNTNDTAKQLIDEVNDLNSQFHVGINKTAEILSAAATQVDAIQKKVKDSLQADINSALDKGFINDIQSLVDKLKQFKQEQSITGADTSLIDRWFVVQAQKVIDGANLAGDAFHDLVTMFPDLTGKVHESTAAIEEQAKAQKALEDANNATAKNIVDFLQGLRGGSASTYSPTATLANARAAFNANLPLAQVGNVDAQNKFTQLADDLLKASRAVNASSQAFQDDLNMVLSTGLGLPAVQSATDPVVIELRNVLSAVNAVNTTTASNPQNIANLILPTMGEAMTPDEFSLKLTGLTLNTLDSVARDRLLAVFNELDGNGNGILEKSEAIKVATQGTKPVVEAMNNAAQTTSAHTVAVNGNTAQANQYLSTGFGGPNATSWATKDMTRALGANDAAESQGVNQHFNNLEALLKAGFNIGTNIGSANSSTFWPFAQGGIAKAGTPIVYAEHSAGGPRYGRFSDDIAITPGMPPWSVGNSGISTLISRVERLEQTLRTGIEGLARAGRDDASNIVDAIGSSASKSNVERRQSARKIASAA